MSAGLCFLVSHSVLIIFVSHELTSFNGAYIHEQPVNCSGLVILHQCV